MKMRCAAALMTIILLLAAVPGAGARADDVFIYCSPIFPKAFSASARYGLMRADGEVLVPTTYPYGQELTDEATGGTRLFAFYSQIVIKDGLPSRESALYDASGKLLCEGEHENYQRLTQDYLTGSRVDGGEYALDILDTQGKVIVENIGSTVVATGDGMHLAMRNVSKTGMTEATFYDAGWKELASVSADRIGYFQHNQNAPRLIPYQDGKLYGYLDTRGKVVLAPGYRYASQFYPCGYATVINNDDKATLIDSAGKELLPYLYSDIIPVGSYSIATIDGQQVMLDKDFAQVTAPGDYLYFITSDYGDKASFAIGQKSNGKSDILLPDGTKVLQDESVSHEIPGDGKLILLGEQNGVQKLQALYDVTTGKSVPLFGDYGYRDGTERYIAYSGDVGATLYDMEGNELYIAEHIYSISDQYYIFQQRRYGTPLQGLIDRDGNLLLPAEYQSLGKINDTPYFMAQRGSVQGYIDLRGEWIVKTSPYMVLDD